MNHFYLACVEEEDLRSLKFKLSQLHRSFLSPWDGSEPLFNPEVPEVLFRTEYKSDCSLLSKGVLQAGEVERLFYGFPFYLDDEDHLAPLFFIQVEVGQINVDEFRLRPTGPEGIQFNHHFLCKQHAPAEEIQEIQQQLEGEYGSFDARLKVACDILGIDETIYKKEKLDNFPDNKSPRDQWYRRPILFRSTRSNYTVHLRSELRALSKYDRFLKVAMNTALGVILAPSALRDKEKRQTPAEKIIEVRPINISQEEALRSGLTRTLTVVTGPPGTGKSQVVVNLLANAAIAGKSVLFASKNNKAVDVVRDWLGEILGSEQDWTFRVGSRERMDEAQGEMTSRLSKMAEDVKDVSTPKDAAKLVELDHEILLLRNNIVNFLQKIDNLSAAIESRRRAEALVPEAWVFATPEGINSVFDSNWLDRGKRETMSLAKGSGLGCILWIKRLLLGSRLMDIYFSKLEEVTSPISTAIRSDIKSELDKGLSWQRLAEAFQKCFDYQYWLQCRYEVSRISKSIATLENADVLLGKFNKIKAIKTLISQELLRNSLTRNIASAAGQALHLVRKYFDLSQKLRNVSDREAWFQIKDEFNTVCDSLLRLFPIWIVTSLSARRALPLRENIFDLIVIDEASITST